MKIIIAGSYQQYKDYLRWAKLEPRETKYACLPEHLDGYRQVDVVLVGTYKTNPLYGRAFWPLVKWVCGPNKPIFDSTW